MVNLGYTLMSEQSGPKDLVRFAALAEQAGFDFEVMSDHYFPWLEEQGHSGYAWSMLGAVTQVTERVELMTYVTCPTMRYHPAVVAQKAATIALLSDNRFTLGLGSGENLNEHVIGEGWPSVTVRHEMFDEAVEIITRLLDGGSVTWSGDYYRVDAARIWDLPDQPIPIGIAVSGNQGIDLFAPKADHLIAVEPNGDLVERWASAHDGPSRSIGQQPICWGPDRDRAAQTAHEQFRWFGGGWKVNADLPVPAGFDAASQFVTEADVADAIPCGPDLDAIAAAIQKWVDAGFTDVALVQIGNDSQEDFLAMAEKELVPLLRGL